MDQSYMKNTAGFPLLMKHGACPLVVSMLVNSLYNIVDSYFVSRISDAAFTALSLVYPVQNLVIAVGIGFGIGINAVISLHLGAGEREQADSRRLAGYVPGGRAGAAALYSLHPGHAGLPAALHRATRR